MPDLPPVDSAGIACPELVLGCVDNDNNDNDTLSHSVDENPSLASAYLPRAARSHLDNMGIHADKFCFGA